MIFQHDGHMQVGVNFKDKNNVLNERGNTISQT